MNQEMKLPENKTCGDCKNLKRCQMLFSCKPINKECDFHPIRFAERPNNDE